MTFIPRQEPFICDNCNKEVQPLEKGSYRNHCPYCLCSKHVDEEGPGDRKSDCGGLMHPIEPNQNSKKGWVILHECVLCGKRIPNRAAPDDDLNAFKGLI
ncbi:RNHCP domain-containing protein [Patescibacteria group bacterium]|nr:RNHCP domain-containing protein [Patescibacteria group bacterium]MBU2259171.1 RNHCP domain-containing protein [Patescibacteria group bacterium]